MAAEAIPESTTEEYGPKLGANPTEEEVDRFHETHSDLLQQLADGDAHAFIRLLEHASGAAVPRWSITKGRTWRLVPD